MTPPRVLPPTSLPLESSPHSSTRLVAPLPLDPAGAGPEKPSTDWMNLLAGARTLSLREMDNVALMNRVDTKYLVPAVTIAPLLADLVRAHRVLQIGDRTIHGYDSVYFDTTDSAMFFAHHRGKRSRYKVRKRTYLDSGQRFLELKEKNNRERTQKERIATTAARNTLDQRERLWLAPRVPHPPECLLPRLQVRFQRLTFVDRDATERMTLDLDLEFALGDQPSEWQRVPAGVAIAEVKRSRGAGLGASQLILRRNGVRPGSFSKFGVGMVLLDPTLKRNHFKPTLLLLAQLGAHR